MELNMVQYDDCGGIIKIIEYTTILVTTCYVWTEGLYIGQAYLAAEKL